MCVFVFQALSQKDTTWTKLFVGGLPYHTTDKTLRKEDNKKLDIFRLETGLAEFDLNLGGVKFLLLLEHLFRD